MFARLCAPGLIPARAGNTTNPPVLSTVTRAHPRSRGEHPKSALYRLLCRGSSPLARGTLVAASRRAFAHGLIPARAGNTRQPEKRTPTLRAHPRSRGEHGSNVLEKLLREGSSPLARGTLLENATLTGKSGLIPARAGNTARSRWSLEPGRAHPRSRGEHTC